MRRQKCQFETLDSRTMLTSLTGDAVEVTDHCYADGGIYTITVTVIDDDTGVAPRHVSANVADVVFADADEPFSPYHDATIGFVKVNPKG